MLDIKYKEKILKEAKENDLSLQGDPEKIKRWLLTGNVRGKKATGWKMAE